MRLQVDYITPTCVGWIWGYGSSFILTMGLPLLTASLYAVQKKIFKTTNAHCIQGLLSFLVMVYNGMNVYMDACTHTRTRMHVYMHA